jgi:hypothetical protein
MKLSCHVIRWWSKRERDQQNDHLQWPKYKYGYVRQRTVFGRMPSLPGNGELNTSMNMRDPPTVPHGYMATKNRRLQHSEGQCFYWASQMQNTTGVRSVQDTAVTWKSVPWVPVSSGYEPVSSRECKWWIETKRRTNSQEGFKELPVLRCFQRLWSLVVAIS